jgi:FkbM family methyltransferase
MKRLRFDLIEVVLILVFVAVAAFALAPTPVPSRPAFELAWEGLKELEPLAQKYHTHYSRDAEEWIVRDFFQDRRDGFFLDVGANDYQHENNTYFLETALGWRGIAIDAQPEFGAGYQQHRPRTKFFAFFVSDVSGQTTEFYVPKKDSLVASEDRSFAEATGGPSVAHAVATITLNDLLDREHVTHVDYLTMDVELSEPKALAGFDVDRFHPELVCVEAHPSVRQAILDYFQQHHYKLLGKYLRLDTANLYFTPIDHT